MIIRSEKTKQNPYVMVNKHFVNNKALSCRAKSLLLYLLSLPDDWCINERELQSHFTDGRASISSGIKELISAGYITRSKTRSAHGKFDNWEYIVKEESTESRKMDCGEIDCGETASTNNEELNNKDTKYKKNNSVDKSPVNVFDSEILECMNCYMNNFYPKRKNKKHPFLRKEQFVEVHDRIKDFYDANSLTSEIMIEMMVKYFNCKSIKSDWNINAFATEGIMQNFLLQCR